MSDDQKFMTNLFDSFSSIRVRPMDALPPRSMMVSRDLYDLIADRLVRIPPRDGGESVDAEPLPGALCDQPGSGVAHELYLRNDLLICRRCGWMGES